MTAFDPKAVDWGRIYAEALEIALSFTSREEDEVVQQGMTLVIDGTAPFDPDGTTTLAAHVVSVGLAARRNRERTERRRRRPKVVGKLTHWLDVEPPTPEELVGERARGERAFEATLAASEGDADVRALVLLAREGVDEPADQAAKLSWPVERVYNARKRVARVLGRVAVELEAWEKEGDS
jgi:hypothetical protein